MIQGFFTTIQEDIVFVMDNISNKTPKQGADKREQEIKVAMAALRIFATIGMAVGIIIAASAIPLLGSATIGALFKMTLGAAICAIFRDLFVMSKNATDQMDLINKAGAVAKSIFSDFVDLFTGKKDINAAPRQPVTENTLFRPLWDAVIARAS